MRDRLTDAYMRHKGRCVNSTNVSEKDPVRCMLTETRPCIHAPGITANSVWIVTILVSSHQLQQCRFSVLFKPLERGSPGWLLSSLLVLGIVVVTTPGGTSGRAAVTRTTLWVLTPRSLTLACQVALDVSGSPFDFQLCSRMYLG